MFRLRLHPTPAGFVLGIAMIAVWALLWAWFIAQLASQTPRIPTAQRADSEQAFWTAARSIDEPAA
jgi:hypothetical protein